MNEIILLACERWSSLFQLSFTISFKVIDDDSDDDFIVRIKSLLLFSSY